MGIHLPLSPLCVCLLSIECPPLYCYDYYYFFTIGSYSALLLIVANAEGTHNGIQLSSLDWPRSHCQRYISIQGMQYHCNHTVLLIEVPSFLLTALSNFPLTQHAFIKSIQLESNVSASHCLVCARMLHEMGTFIIAVCLESCGMVEPWSTLP